MEWKISNRYVRWHYHCGKRLERQRQQGTELGQHGNMELSRKPRLSLSSGPQTLSIHKKDQKITNYRLGYRRPFVVLVATNRFCEPFCIIVSWPSIFR